MSESTDAAAGGRRGGRTVSKSTPDEVMELACGLPLTRSVLRSVVAGRHARPARRAGRPVQGRERQPDGIQARQADQERGIPVRQGLRRIRLGHGVVPRRLGARAAHGPRFRGPGRGPRALRRRGMRQDAHGDRHGHAGVREGHAGEVLHRVVAGDAFAAGRGTRTGSTRNCAR
ncbi:insertion element membrane protein [Bifidobacterium adolescentis]|nr:insertion element membrane protein [Bifidobacterium adolescentis]